MDEKNKEFESAMTLNYSEQKGLGTSDITQNYKNVSRQTTLSYRKQLAANIVLGQRRSGQSVKMYIFPPLSSPCEQRCTAFQFISSFPAPYY